MFMSDTQMLRACLVTATVERARKVGLEEAFRDLVEQQFAEMSDMDVRTLARAVI